MRTALLFVVAGDCFVAGCKTVHTNHEGGIFGRALVDVLHNDTAQDRRPSRGNIVARVLREHGCIRSWTSRVCPSRLTSKLGRARFC